MEPRRQWDGELDLLVLTSYYPPPFQAASNRVVSLGKYLKRNYPGTSIGFLVLGKETPESTEKDPWPVSCHSWAFRPTPLNPIFLLWAIWICVRRLISLRPRFVMVTTPPANTLLAGLIGSRILGIPVIIDMQDDWEGVYLDSFPESGPSRHAFRLALGLYGMLARSIYGSAIYILAADETLGKIIRDQYSGRIAAVLNGLEMEELDLARTQRRPNGEIPKLVFCGELSWRPGIIHVVAPHLGKQENGGWKMNIIGEGTEESVRRLRTIFDGDDARFLGSFPRGDALKIIASSDAALLAMTEGYQLEHLLPVKLMDYLACGTPVLAVIPPNSFAAYKIEELSAGIVVPNAEPGRIPGALRDLCSPEWKKITRKSGAEASSIFDSSKQWRRMISRIPQIVDGTE
jgi:glycosyltransferase involved in cell wall biosynthesis